MTHRYSPSDVMICGIANRRLREHYLVSEAIRQRTRALTNSP